MMKVKLLPNDQKKVERIIEWLNNPENGGSDDAKWTKEDLPIIVSMALNALADKLGVME